MTLPPELAALLSRCIACPDERESLAKEVWKRYGRESCIVATDLEGFTACTERDGAVHALALLQIQIELAVPVLAEHGGRLVKVEGDSLFLAFGSPHQAVTAALALRARVAAHNAGQGIWSLGICQGIACGPLLDIGNDVYGEPINIASKLGEDIAQANEILVTGEVFTAVAEELECAAMPKEVRFGGHDRVCWLLAAE